MVLTEEDINLGKPKSYWLLGFLKYKKKYD